MHRFGFELPHERAIVLSAGMAARNLGAAFAPLPAAPEFDQRTLIMVVLGQPFMTGAALLAARWFGRAAAMLPDEPP
jgi:hypothetical protein